MEKQKKLKTGEFLFREGDEAHAMYLVHKGTISIQVLKGETPLELARVNANEVLGELAFFNRTPRSATAVAVSDVELSEIPFSALDRIYQTVPPYLQTIFASVASRLKKATATIRQMSTSPATPTEEKAQLSALLEMSVSLDPEAVMVATSAADKRATK